MPLGQRPGEPKHNPEAANWQRCGSMTDFFLFHNPPLWSCMGVVVVIVCLSGAVLSWMCLEG